MRNIPVKNYVVFVILCGVTIFLTYYFCNLYNERYQKSYTTIMLPFMTEIKENDIENVLENPTVVFYVSDKTNSSLEDLEIGMKELLTEQNIYNYFFYIDISTTGKDSLYQFQKEYGVTLDYESLPILIVFQDRELKEIYNDKNWNLTDVTNFLIRNEVIESD